MRCYGADKNVALQIKSWAVKFEEQKSTNIRVAECLANASKNGKGVGKPEFIITFPTQSMDYLIIV